MTDRLPKSLRRRAGLRCWCNRPVPATSACGCCCGEHDYRPPKTDGGPSLREYLTSKGER